MSPRKQLLSFALILAPTFLGVACAGAQEEALVRELDAAQKDLAPFALDDEHHEEVALGEDLSSYLAFAMKQNPSLRASFEGWRAAVLSISTARRPPEPVLSTGVMLVDFDSLDMPMVTRVGIEQMIPWPSKLRSGAEAAEATARSMAREFDAEMLEVALKVKEAYYTLWSIRETRRIQLEQLELLMSLAASAKARVAAMGTSIADVQQIDMAVTRLKDKTDRYLEMEAMAEARLIAAVGAPPGADAPTASSIPNIVPFDEPEEALLAELENHPLVSTMREKREASLAEARRVKTERWPELGVGLEWSRNWTPGSDGKERGGLMAGLGISIPLWQKSYSDKIHSAEAEAYAREADAEASLNEVSAELLSTLAALRDAARRAKLNETVLNYQARSTYESVLGAYMVGDTNVASALMAERELLEVELDTVTARVDHAMAEAKLEQLLGRPLHRPSKEDEHE